MLTAKPALTAQHLPARGVAALTVVMVLFFVMALVAAYTNRNLIFEQRISIGNYRTSRAMDAAEAASNWTLSLLNGGRINTNCQPSASPGDLDYRRLAIVEVAPAAYGEGGYNLPAGAAQGAQLVSGCIIANGTMSCTCPTTTTPNPAITVPADGKGSAFHSTFFLAGDRVLPGAIGVGSYGCGSLGSGTSDCSRSVVAGPQVDGVAGVQTTVGLLRALPLAPKAALTAGDTVDASAGSLLVTNPDSGSGYTVMAGGAINPGVGSQFVVPAGSVGDGKIQGISALHDLSVDADLWFRTFFGMPLASYQAQPAAQVLDCAVSCSQADLATVIASYPRNPIVVVGNFVLDTAASLGTPAEPLMLVVTGSLTVSATTQIVGFVHAGSVIWSAGAGTATLSGALVSATTFTTATTARLAYDRPVMDTVRLRYGSFVRTPGSWNMRGGYR